MIRKLQLIAIYLAILLKHHARSLSLIPKSRVNYFFKAEVQVSTMSIFSKRQVILQSLRRVDSAYSSYCVPKTLVFLFNCSSIVAEKGLSVKDYLELANRFVLEFLLFI